MKIISTRGLLKSLFAGLFALVLFCLQGAAQERIITPLTKVGNTKNDSRCYTVPYMNELYKQAGVPNADAAFEVWMLNKIKERKGLQTLGPVINYNLPIVFHVIHSGSSPGVGDNISQARIQAQLAQVNKDFANLSNSPHAVAASSGLQFYLAQNDPTGVALAEPGIHRINATVQFPSWPAAPYASSDVNTQIKPNTIWDPTRYINVWVLPLADDILGFATFPTASGLDGLSAGETIVNAGVVVDGFTVGSLVNQSVSCSFSGYNGGKTLVHELGHFFGLRHIWGDATCGNDFVDDTPIHEKANFGVPTSPKPNNCGTLDEMFQNYMDYSEDIILSTFTAKQIDRMQAVMLNSPRRKELATSNVGVVNYTSNRISFVACGGSLSVSETGNTGDPLRYRDVNIALSAEHRANGAATVTINAAGTATSGVDFTLQTPSVTFANGDGFKIVTIRIWDDGIPENTETVLLSYSISGTGVTAGPTAQTVLTIMDDDNFTVGQTPIALLRQNFDTTVTGWNILSNETSPTNTFTAGAGATGFTGRSAYITNNPTLGEAAPNEYTIDDAGGSLSILRTPLVNATGLSNLSISFKYKSVGEQDDDGIYDFGSLVFAPASNGLLFNTVPVAPVLVDNPSVVTSTYNFPSSFNNTSFFLGFYWENDDNTGTQPPLAVDDIVVTGSGQKIAQTLGASRGNLLPAASRVFFTSVQNSELIALVENASADAGIVIASLSQAGTTQENIVTPKGTFKRSAKVAKISPRATFGGTSRVTIYFTQAEVAVWGNSVNTLKVMQVNDNVNLASELNEGNAVVLTPTINNQLAEAGYIAYTVNVTGFSQFFLVESATILPVQFISFTAQANAKTIALQWQTANEVNNKGFGIERSTDGNNYTSIGFVAGKGGLGSSVPNVYSFTDATAVAGTLYYYRLRQEDRDGNTSYSAVRTATIAALGKYNVYPNPAQGKVRLTPGRSFVGSVQLLNQAGQVLKSWQQQAIPLSGIELQLPNLPAGVYTLQVNDGGKLNALRITIQ